MDRTTGAPNGFAVNRRVQSVSTHVDYARRAAGRFQGNTPPKWVDDRKRTATQTRRARSWYRDVSALISSVGWTSAPLASMLWSANGGVERAMGAGGRRVATRQLVAVVR